MCNRRNKPIIQGAVLLVLVTGLGYTFYLYNLSVMDLEISRTEADKYLKQQESLSSQLQVVYEHRARLERSLQKEKTEHKNTKLEFSKKQNDFLLNITRSKHEAMNRFNSLDTQYNMLKSQSKELETDYSRLQQQYSRLSSEQSELVKQQRRNFQLYKEQKTNEIASLDEEIKALKQQVVSLRTHLKSKSDEAEQYKSSSSRALAAVQEYRETLKALQEQLAIYKEKLKNVVTQPTPNEAIRRVTQDKGVKTEARHQDFSEKRADKHEQVEMHQERISVTEPLRHDGRRYPDSSHRQVNVQSKDPSDSHVEQADRRRPPDKNADEQRRDVDQESQTHDRTRFRRSDREKASDDSQNDGYSRYGNVPLRDTNQDTRVVDKEAAPRVVSPVENNAMNKWSNILKAAQQGHQNEGGRREETKKVTNEGFEEENGDERKTSDEDREQLGEQEAADEQIGKPVVEAGHVGDRVGLQGDQHNNEGGLQGDIGHRNQDSQEKGLDMKEVEEGEKEQEADGLSRDKMNKKVAELEESYQEQQIEEQKQLQAAQPQAFQPQERDARVRATGDQKVAPIPAVQRQDTPQDHQARADPDNDDEDVDAENEQEDPDEQDPDDAGEEDGDNFEEQDSPQQQQQDHQEQLQPHDDRKYDRSLKAADADANNEHNRQETKRT